MTCGHSILLRLYIGPAVSQDSVFLQEDGFHHIWHLFPIINRIIDILRLVLLSLRCSPPYLISSNFKWRLLHIYTIWRGSSPKAANPRGQLLIGLVFRLIIKSNLSRSRSDHLIVVRAALAVIASVGGGTCLFHGFPVELDTAFTNARTHGQIRQVHTKGAIGWGLRSIHKPSALTSVGYVGGAVSQHKVVT